MKRWRVGVVGAGLIGGRRARVAHEHPKSEMILVADVDLSRAQAVAAQVGASAVGDWREVVTNPDIVVVVIATPTDSHAPIALEAFKHGKHVLCEKPLARNPLEARRMVQMAKRRKRLLKTGFNHRYHPAILKAHGLASRGEIGKLLFARCVYGHGGRAGYEKEWRAKPEISGGGQLTDQGVHVLDLFRWFLGEFREVFGYAETLYWPLKDVEDNAFGILRTRQGAIAQFHTSWTQWKNRFSFEVYGDKGYVLVHGLGGSYGPERLTVGKRTGPGEIPQERTEEFEGPDRSWADEWEDFLGALEANREPLGTGKDGYEAMRLARALYESSRTRRAVKV